MNTHVLMADKNNKLMFAMDDRLFWGEGLFETLKVAYGKPQCAYLHWQRLGKAAQQLAIPFNLSYKQWLMKLLQKIQQENLACGGIKAILSAGSASASRGLAQQGQASLLRLQTFQYSQPLDPLHLVRAPWLRDAANPIYQVKSTNYLEAILARRQALLLGADDALFFNFHHHATETTCANLFLIHQETVFTPPLADGVLPGITRARVLDLCKQQKINCVELSITNPMIHNAEAVFITNALQGIQEVRSIGDVHFAVEHLLIEHLKSSLRACKNVLD